MLTKTSVILGIFENKSHLKGWNPETIIFVRNCFCFRGPPKLSSTRTLVFVGFQSRIDSLSFELIVFSVTLRWMTIKRGYAVGCPVYNFQLNGNESQTLSVQLQFLPVFPEIGGDSLPKSQKKPFSCKFLHRLIHGTTKTRRHAVSVFDAPSSGTNERIGVKLHDGNKKLFHFFSKSFIVYKCKKLSWKLFSVPI